MEQPVIVGVFSYAAATQILGQCALGKKVISLETRIENTLTDWGVESNLIDEPVYAKAWISLADSSMFLWANIEFKD